MEIIHSVLNFLFHLDKSLDVIIQGFGVWTYLLLFVIIFAETGLVVTPFLPGDSLLFVVGAFAAAGSFNLLGVLAVLVSAAILGDTVNYSLGKIFGKKLLEAKKYRIIKKEHIEKTHKFYEKYGGKTIILARFVPVVRTFAPFVAGLGKMSYGKFIVYNITGGLLWVFGIVLTGYFFGNIPLVRENFSIVVMAIIVISIMPIVIEFFKHKKNSRNARSKAEKTKTQPENIRVVEELAVGK